MSIVSSEVIINRPDRSDFDRRIREKHIEHLSNTHIRSLNYTFTTDPADYVGDEIAYELALATEYAPILAQHALDLDSQLGQQEVQQWIQEMASGKDPWHTAPFIPSTPEFNDWDTAASESLKHYLLIDSRQELLNVKASVDNTSNNDLTDLLVAIGSTFSQTDLRAEIQIAVDNRASMDLYSPSVVE